MVDQLFTWANQIEWNRTAFNLMVLGMMVFLFLAGYERGARKSQAAIAEREYGALWVCVQELEGMVHSLPEVPPPTTASERHDARVMAYRLQRANNALDNLYDAMDNGGA